MRLPSGDQAAFQAVVRPPPASRRIPEPSALATAVTVDVQGPIRKATLRPSGESTGPRPGTVARTWASPPFTGTAAMRPLSAPGPANRMLVPSRENRGVPAPLL